MYIFAGCYERFIFGFSASADCSEPQEVVKRYTFAAHKSAVKCLVAAGPYVASGGADDLIHIYNMKTERDLGVIMNPCDGAVPCLDFYTPEGRFAPSHMFGGSEDGAINIWRCKDWEHLKVMRGHKASVNSLAVHYSGRLALSVSRDRTLRMWSLTRGSCVYTAPIETVVDEVAFSESGEVYRLVSGTRITVHSTSGEGGLQAALTAPHRITCCASHHDQLLLLGLEDGSVRLWDVRTSALVGGWAKAHGSRLKGMAVLQRGSGQLPNSLCTASSDGTIKLWDTRKLGGGAATAASSGDAAAAATCTSQMSTGARLTCLAVVDPSEAAPRRQTPKPATTVAMTPPRAKKAKKRDEGDSMRKEVKDAADRRGAQRQKDNKAAAKPSQQKQQPQGGGGGKAATATVSKGGRKGSTRGGQTVDDDPGFEVVPAEYDDEDVDAQGVANIHHNDNDADEHPLGCDDGDGETGKEEKGRPGKKRRKRHEDVGHTTAGKRGPGKGGHHGQAPTSPGEPALGEQRPHKQHKQGLLQERKQEQQAPKHPPSEQGQQANQQRQQIPRRQPQEQGRQMKQQQLQSEEGGVQEKWSKGRGQGPGREDQQQGEKTGRFGGGRAQLGVRGGITKVKGAVKSSLIQKKQVTGKKGGQASG